MNQSTTRLSPSPAGGDYSLYRQIHQALLPRSLPAVAGIEMNWHFQPCPGLGGDLFDVIQINDDLIAFCVVDVARQGSVSTLIAALFKNIWLEYVRAANSPQVLLKRICETLATISTDFNITAFVGFLDLHVNRLIYSNAGHASPIVVRRSGPTLETLDCRGPFLGNDLQDEIPESEVFLYPGDWIVLFTDGLYARLGGNDAAAGRSALESLLSRLCAHPATAFIRQLETLDGEQQHSRLEDDATVLTIEILTQSRKELIKERLGFRREDPVFLQFISYYEEMDHAAATILKEMDSAGYGDECIRKMKIVLVELCANAIGHGNREDHSKKVTLGHLIDRHSAAIAIMDEGPGYNPGQIKDPTLIENLSNDHGRGLYIVRSYVDEVSLNETGNRIFIRKLRT